MDDVLIDVLEWPTRNRRGQAIDNTSVLLLVLEEMENPRGYTPGYAVLKRQIMAFAKGAKSHESRWSLVRRAFALVYSTYPSFWPDHEVLVIGMDTSEALLDSKLAADLISRVIAHESEKMLRTPHNAVPLPGGRGSHTLPPSPTLPFLSIVKAIEVAVHKGDLESIQVILDCCSKVQSYIPEPILQTVFTMALKAYANAGKPKLCVEIVEEMDEVGLETW